LQAPYYGGTGTHGFDTVLHVLQKCFGKWRLAVFSGLSAPSALVCQHCREMLSIKNINLKQNVAYNIEAATD